MASAPPSRVKRVFLDRPQDRRLSAGRGAGRARRRRVGRDQPAAELSGAGPPRRSRPDDPGPRRRRQRHRFDGPELRRMAALSTRSRRSCATRWSRSRTGASARIPASIRSASPAASRSASRQRPLARRAARPSPSSSPATSSSPTTAASAARCAKAILALALEWRFSKDQILELYLNRVYFGGGAYGIDAASRRFFGHSATELSLSEAAIIAGLVKAPSNYSPTADAEAARGRAGVVLDLMVRNGAISAGRGGGRRAGATSSSSATPTSRTASATSPTGCCRSSTR